MPFGMVQLSPDTRNTPDWGVACGYNYNDTSISGFSHTHLSGTGVAELFDVMLMPFSGAAVKEEAGQNAYQSKFSHEKESAKPGYYSVELLDYQIKAELTTTTHAGFHKYSFPKNKEAHIVIDLDHSMKKSDWNTRIIMAYDDWCVAELAKKLGKTDDYKHFKKRSQFYKNLYDQQIGFFRAKDNKGNWIGPFDPLKYGANGGYPFTEGNGWQYFWYVPQDIKGLVDLVGGDILFTQKLDTFFTLEDKPSEVNDNASGFIGQYAHGNEPSHHIAYLYNYAGQPWKTQQYVAEILKKMYNTTSSGYSGNDDCGELSAWYIFSAMGFYPVNPANSVYVIGSPLLKEASIQLKDGKTFKVIAKNVSGKNIYIQSVKLNGKSYPKTFIRQADIDAGGTLEFIMGPKPNKKWGTKLEDRPGN